MRICCESSAVPSQARSGCCCAQTRRHAVQAPHGACAPRWHSTSCAAQVASHSPPAPGASWISSACGKRPALKAAVRVTLSAAVQGGGLPPTGGTARTAPSPVLLTPAPLRPERPEGLRDALLDLGEGRRGIDDPETLRFAARPREVNRAHLLEASD